MKIRVCKEFNFEMAHALDHHKGKCKYLHGHSYKLFVTIKGVPNTSIDKSDSGMVLDFSELKQIVKTKIIDVYDHSLVLYENSKYLTNIKDWPNQERVYLKKYQPTCENLLTEFVRLIENDFNSNIELVNMKLHETVSSYAEWRIEDQ